MQRSGTRGHRERRYEWTQLRDGAVDWPAVMWEIRAIGYDDYVITEVCGLPGKTQREVFAETLQRMEEILGL